MNNTKGMSDEDEAVTELHHDQYDSTSAAAGGVERAIGAVETAAGDADVSIYGELTPGSANRILRIIQADQADQGSQGSQGSQDEDTTIATPVSILDVGSGTNRVLLGAANASDNNGFDVVYMFDDSFTPSLMQHICIQWAGVEE
jgi:hypothetical protein